MVLSDEQSGRFFDTMDALLYYVNARFRVVEGFTLDYDGAIGDMKAALVARALWENVEIIDEFVRENPARLSPQCLDVARSWKAALPGLYTLVRYQGGRAILMNDVGVFSVSGVTLELEGEIGRAPAFVEMVLLPFEDVIVYDGFLQAFDGDGSASEAARVQDEFENRCSAGIVSTGAEFLRVAEAWLAAEREREIDALLADVAREAAGEDEELPAGFHRSSVELDGTTGYDPVVKGWTTGTEVIVPDGTTGYVPVVREEEARADRAVNCAIACVLNRGVVEIGEAFEQYAALVPEGTVLSREDFEALVRHEASFADSYFGLWEFEGREYLIYFSLTPDYIAKSASMGGEWRGLREELEYYESYRRSLLEARREVPAKPLSRTLLENTPLGELLRNENVVRLRRFLNERIPDGEDDATFAAAAAQEFVLTAVESGSLGELYRLAEDLGVVGCCADDTRLPRLVTNVFNAMPSWENNGWSPQELYEQLTGRRVFYNEDGTVARVGRDDACPCGSGLKYGECHGR